MTAAPTFLRLDRPELEDGTTMVVLAVPPADRERRRSGAAVPLAYLYERVDPTAPEHDMRMDAGHYDEVNQIWSFDGDVTAIAGLTEPMTPVDAVPGEPMEVDK